MTAAPDLMVEMIRTQLVPERPWATPGRSAPLWPHCVSRVRNHSA